MSSSTPFQVKYPPYFDDVSNSLVDDVDLSSDNSVNSWSKDGRNDIHLAERTSEILQNYRAFLQEYDLETSATQINPPDDNSRNLQYHENRISTHGTATNYDVSMLRDFSMPIDQLRSIDNDRAEEQRARRTMRPFLSSKGVKYGVLLGLAMLVIVAVMLSPEKSSNKNTANEVDQNHTKEAEYILEHEDVNEGEPLLASTNDSPALAASLATGNAALLTVRPTFNPTVFPTSFTDVPTYEPSSVSSSAEVLEPIQNNGNSGNITAEVPSEILQIVHDKFMPLWLSSEEGWKGGAMLDAVAFCNNIGKELCPYSIMCPNGPNQSVMDGRREEDSIEGEEGDQYAPVAIVKSGAWVRINGDETCTPHPPSLSMDVSYYEMKKHIMCCTPNVL